jgi:hypothetical protein
MPTASTRRPDPRRDLRRDPLTVLPHVTGRDRQLLDLIDHHRVFTSDQLHRVFFTGLRRAQQRLTTLHGLGLLDRFRFAPTHGGTQPWKWVLGYGGAHLQAAAAGRPGPTERAHREHVLRLSTNPTLDHLLATNEFFVRLHHTARLQAGTGLDRWWSEHTSTAAFAGIQPDGHALWTAGGHTVGLFLECDLGTENLPRLTGKLPGYARLVAGGGPRYPVLFWLPSRTRETNLQRLLRIDPPPVPVATAVHGSDPAGPVWLPADSWRRIRLTDLPSDHGPDSASNPNWHAGRLDLSAAACVTTSDSWHFPAAVGTAW